MANEEALLAAGYVKARPNNQGNDRERFPWGRGGYTNFGEKNMKHTKKSKKMNPKGPDGRPLTCNCCGSFRHLLIDCPDSWENMEKGSDEEDEHTVLFVSINCITDTEKGEHLKEKTQHHAILDSACSSTVCGKKWLASYMKSLNKKERGKIRRSVLRYLNLGITSGLNQKESIQFQAS